MNAQRGHYPTLLLEDSLGAADGRPWRTKAIAAVRVVFFGSFVLLINIFLGNNFRFIFKNAKLARRVAVYPVPSFP